MFARSAILLLFTGVGLFTGCAHHQLQYDTVHQAKSLNTIYERQVLDNLAMFCQNPYALPFFAIPGSGNSTVSDNVSASAGAPLNPFFTMIGLGVQRTHGGQWTLKTVSDPQKLKRMRCAYQRAVGCADNNCIDCCELEKEWQGKAKTEKLACDGLCAIGSGWYCCSDKKMIPHACNLVGNYCGTYVYVLPEGRDQFTRLVLAIIDYAVNEPKPLQTLPEKIVETRSYKNNLLIRTETTIERVVPKNPGSSPGPSVTVEEFKAMKKQFEIEKEAYKQVTGRTFDQNEAMRMKYYRPAPPRQKSPDLLYQLREDELLRQSVR